MKYLFLSLLIVLPITSFSASLIMTDEEYKTNEVPDAPLNYSGLPEKFMSVPFCKECFTVSFKQLSEMREKKRDQFESYRKAYLGAVDNKDDKKIAEYDDLLTKTQNDYDAISSVVSHRKSEYKDMKAKERSNQMALELAQCKGTSKEESLVVDDSNRSFFGKVMSIFNWKRDTPAPVEDRVLSK